MGVIRGFSAECFAVGPYFVIPAAVQPLNAYICSSDCVSAAFIVTWMRMNPGKHISAPSRSLGTARHKSSGDFSRASGSFHTSERRGGVERRQVELKGVEVCRD